MSFMRPAKCFSTAVQALMAPHPYGVEESIFVAFRECSEGLSDMPVDRLDGKASQLVKKLRKLMDYSHLQIGPGESGLRKKAEMLGVTEQIELSEVVVELQNWFSDAHKNGL